MSAAPPPAKRSRTSKNCPPDSTNSTNASTPAVPPPTNATGDPPRMPPPPPFILRIGHKSESKTEFTEEEKRYMQQKLGTADQRRFTKMLRDMKPMKEPRRLRVLRSNLPMATKSDIFRHLAENDSNKYEEWVENVLRLPIGKFAEKPKNIDPQTFLQNAMDVMNTEITGHIEAKHEVLRLMNAWITSNASRGFALGLEGEPGVGKTTFVKYAISKSMGRPFCFISLGGASDASGLLGHSYTYEGAIYGRLSECLITSKVMDPIIFFDELDKISTSGKGEELVHALLHLTDPIQNEHIRDRYFHGINLDLSRAVLVFSYNDASRVNPILLDRIKRISLNSPNSQQRVEISRNHLIPRALTQAGLTLDIPNDVIEYIIKRNSGEPGMRSVEKDLNHVIQSFSLIKSYGSSSVLGLDRDAIAIDLKLALSVLGERETPTVRQTMMYC